MNEAVLYFQNRKCYNSKTDSSLYVAATISASLGSLSVLLPVKVVTYTYNAVLLGWDCPIYSEQTVRVYQAVLQEQNIQSCLSLQATNQTTRSRALSWGNTEKTMHDNQ